MLTLPDPAQIRASRLRLGLTQAELADAAGVSQSLVARVERGGVDPSYGTLRAIVEALNQAERKQEGLADLMTRRVVFVRPGDPVGRAVRIMRQRGISQLPVLDRGVPVGRVGEQDVVRALEAGQPLSRKPVRDVMGPPLPAVSPEEPLDSVRHFLENNPAVLVMQRGRVRGIVTKADILETIE